MGRSDSRETAGYSRALIEFLDTFADDGEQWEARLHREVATRLVALVRPVAGDTCLDIGGGGGLVASALREAVGPTGSVVSTDTGEGSAEMSRPTDGATTHRMTMTGDDLGFGDRTFDVAVMSRSTAYEFNPYAVIGEASRTLRVGGRLALFCRRRGLATRAEQAFLAELAVLARQHPLNVPEEFLEYPGLSDRREVEMVLRTAGLEHIVFGDVVTGGRSSDAAAWNREMMGCWPAARILLGALGTAKRLQFEEQIARLMGGLGDDGFRFHHPYLLAAGTRAPDSPSSGIDPRHS